MDCDSWRLPLPFGKGLGPATGLREKPTPFGRKVQGKVNTVTQHRIKSLCHRETPRPSGHTVVLRAEINPRPTLLKRFLLHMSSAKTPVTDMSFSRLPPLPASLPRAQHRTQTVTQTASSTAKTTPTNVAWLRPRVPKVGGDVSTPCL